MALVALTNVKHGTGHGGFITLAAGEAVPEDLDEKVIEELKAQGAIGEPVLAVPTAEQADKDARIKELEAQLIKTQEEKAAVEEQLTSTKSELEVAEKELDELTKEPE